MQEGKAEEGSNAVTEADLLAKYRSLLDLKDEAAAVLSGINKDIDACEAAIRESFEASGKWEDGCAAKAGGVTVTVRQKWRAKYMPEHWESIVKWAAETGNAHLIQRRLSDKPVMELLDAGVSLPEGLTVEAYKDLVFLRTA